MKKYTFLLFVLVSLSISAQNISTGYHSNSFGLRSSSNPSAFPETKFVLGFPGLSNLNIGLQVPLSLNETLVVGSDDSLRVSLPKMTSNLLENNLISHSLRNQLFHFGMKVGAKKKVFIYIGDELVLDAGIQFSDKFINYLSKGNAAFLNQQMSFDAQKLKFTSYNSFYLGSAVKVNEDLEVGARIKFLNGIANVTFDKFNLGFYTDSTSSPIYTTTLSSDVMIQTSGQGAIEDTLEFDPMKNFGFAIDFGASYSFSEKLSASFALNDIGTIHWEESNNKLYSTNGVVDFEFSGLTQSSSDAEDLELQMEEIVDSLITIMEPQETVGAYSTKLNPNLFIGLSYTLNSKHSFSGLYHRRKSIDEVLNTISLGYQYNLGKSIQLLASGQFINGVGTLASGVVWSPGVVQMHLLLDNILAADVFDAKSLFIQFGISFYFGK
jgi:hypothetical protein